MGAIRSLMGQPGPNRASGAATMPRQKASRDVTAAPEARIKDLAASQWRLRRGGNAATKASRDSRYVYRRAGGAK